MDDDPNETFLPPYGAPVPNDTRGWVEINVGTLKPGDRPIPFQLFANRFKSSSEDFELFLHDPLRQMQENPGALEGLAVQGFTNPANLTPADLHNNWHVTTFAANHHRRLSHIHAYALNLIGPDGVHIMLYKDADPDQ